MSTATHSRAAARTTTRRRGHNPLAAPLLLFVAVAAAACGYIAYVLWPRWPDAPMVGDVPSLPIVIAGTTFNIEPAAIRVPMQRRAGTQERVDLDYLWPSLVPPDPRAKPTGAAAGKINDRLFVTIASAGATLSLEERLRDIYPRFLARCTRHGIANQGTCLMERRIGGANVTFRFPRDWLGDWRALAAGIDRLLARLHPQ